MIEYARFRAVVEQTHGRDGLSVRHELFHHAVSGGRWRSKPSQFLRSVAVAFRDAAWLWLRGDRPARPLEAGTVALAATLPGPTGLELMRRAGELLGRDGFRSVIVAHPRLRRVAGATGRVVAWPGIPALLRAARRAWLIRGGRHGQLSAAAVQAALWRREIWREAWAATIAPATPVVMHDDVEAMMVAAVGATRRTACLQHGLPTEELFPVLAERQVVWSRRAAGAYRSAGVPESAIVVDPIGRRVAVAVEPGPPPAGIVLVSQTHATILRGDIRDRLATLAGELAGAVPRVEILLHPEEVRRGHPYTPVQGMTVRIPPHPQLIPGGTPPRLVIGLLSTALVDAAAAGHFVAGLDWPLDGNRAAAALGRPPATIGDAPGAVTLLRRLQGSAAVRSELAAAQRGWVESLFDPPTGGLSATLSESTGGRR